MPASAVDSVNHPSSLTPKQRLELLHEYNVADYNRLWRKAYAPTVWERLMADAGTRHFKASTIPKWQDGATAAFFHPGTLSGYSTNTDRAVYTHTSFRAGHNPELQPQPMSLTHPLLMKRFSHKHKIDYMTAIRPDTETTSQLMRMMGTYETDYPHAARATVHIPPSCPANPPSYFHPDVRLSDLSYATAQRTADSLRPRTGAGLRRSRPMSAHAVLTSSSAASPATKQRPSPPQAPVSPPPAQQHAEHAGDSPAAEGGKAGGPGKGGAAGAPVAHVYASAGGRFAPGELMAESEPQSQIQFGYRPPRPASARSPVSQTSAPAAAALPNNQTYLTASGSSAPPAPQGAQSGTEGAGGGTQLKPALRARPMSASAALSPSGAAPRSSLTLQAWGARQPSRHVRWSPDVTAVGEQ